MAKPTGPIYEHDCPFCHAKAGQWCKRPSGHQGPLVEPHKARRELVSVPIETEPMDVGTELNRLLATKFPNPVPAPRIAYLRDILDGKAMVPAQLINCDDGEVKRAITAKLAKLKDQVFIAEAGKAAQETSDRIKANPEPDYTDADIKAYENAFELWLTARPATAKKKIDKMNGAGVLRYAYSKIRYPETKKAILRRLKAIKADPPREKATS